MVLEVYIYLDTHRTVSVQGAMIVTTASLIHTFINQHKPSIFLWDIGKQCRPISDATERISFGCEILFVCFFLKNVEI